MTQRLQAVRRLALSGCLLLAACAGGGILCLLDPCAGKKPVCVNNTCLVK